MISKKIHERLKKLRYVGYFTEAQAQEKQMRLAKGQEKNLCLYWLVDEADGVIADAKFQAFGPVSIIALGEIASELVLRKNYDQASRISADLLDRHLRDHKDEPAFASEAHSFFNQALSAIDRAVYECLDIPFISEGYDTTPIAWDLEDRPFGIEGWEDFPLAQKLQVLEEVLEKEIRPYVALDAGGVSIRELKDAQVHIAYEGSCTTCHSATGSTLSAIQQIFRRRVHPSLTVIPIL